MGIPESQTLIFMAVLLVIVVAYTVLGGMYCVVLTDVLQFVMIVFSAGLTTWMMIRAAGGLGQHDGGGFRALWPGRIRVLEVAALQPLVSESGRRCTT